MLVSHCYQEAQGPAGDYHLRVRNFVGELGKGLQEEELTAMGHCHSCQEEPSLELVSSP